MTNFEKFKNMTVEELTKFINDHGMYDNTPWMNWWDNNYCSKCESIKASYEESKSKLGITPFYDKLTVECSYCEVYDKCKYFPDLDDVPDMKAIVHMWLESESN